MCDRTVTLVRYDGREYASWVIRGVSWRHKAVVELQDKGLKAAPAVTVRVPEANMPDALTPKPGDYLLDGAHTEVISGPKDMPGALRVLMVGDNRRGGAPHWKVMCG